MKMSMRAREQPFRYYGLPFILFMVMGQMMLSRMIGGRHELEKERTGIQAKMDADADLRGKRNFIKRQININKEATKILEENKPDDDYELVPIAKPDLGTFAQPPPK